MSTYRKEKPAMKPWQIVAAAILGVILIGALGAGIFATKVALSAPVGQGKAVIQKNSAANWTAAQARFEDLYSDVVATDSKITVAAEAAAADPDDKTARQTLAGTKAYCLEVVGDYNAEARKYLAADFRAVDLPAQIDTTDRTTDCKEN